MEGTFGTGNRLRRLPGETPGTSGSAGYAGTWRRSALEGARTSSGCRTNPMGAADLSKIRRSPSRLKTLGCRSDASWFAQVPRTQAREGTSGGESSCDGSGIMCSGGGSQALGPRPWNQGGRAQVPSSLRSSRPRIPQSSRPTSTVDERVQQHGNVLRPHRSKESGEHEPHERQRTQRVRKAGGRATRRGGEKPRGRMVPGRGRPG